MGDFDVSIIMSIHNEAEYLNYSLGTLKKIESQMKEFIVILDKCTDNSKDIVKKYFHNAKIIEKNICSWKNSYAENLQIGYKISAGSIICIHDADIKSPPEFLNELLKELKGNIKSVSPAIYTYKEASLTNLIHYYWEKTRKIAPLGEEPRGGVRVIIKGCLDEIGGFKDVIAPDTQLDIDLRSLGFQSKLCKNVICFHLRKITLRKTINTQIMSGKMRRQIGMPFWRVLGHSILRLRLFVIYGYLKGGKQDERQ